MTPDHLKVELYIIEHGKKAAVDWLVKEHGWSRREAKDWVWRL